MTKHKHIAVGVIGALFTSVLVVPHAVAYNFLHETEFAEAVQNEERVSRSRLKTNDYADRTRDLEQQFAERQHQAGSQLGRDTSDTISIEDVAINGYDAVHATHLSASLVSGDMRIASRNSMVSGDMRVASLVSPVSADVSISPIGSYQDNSVVWAEQTWQPPYLAHTGLETYAIALLALLAVMYVRMTLVAKWTKSLCSIVRKS